MALSENEDIEEILDSVHQLESKVDKILAHLGIVPDISGDVTNIDESIEEYKIYAKQVLKIEDSTIKSHGAVLNDFLTFSNGQVSIESVKVFLATQNNQNWKNKQIKALRRYCRDFLGLGHWIESFEIIDTSKIKQKEFVSDNDLEEFYDSLSGISKIVFLLLHCTGLRLDEVLKLMIVHIDYNDNSIDATEFHSGQTKFSWYTFITQQVAIIIKTYIRDNPEYFDVDRVLCPLTARGVELEFQKVSNDLGMQVTPKDLRLIWSRKLTDAGVHEKYIDAMQGRIKKKSIQRKHYSDYSKQNLRKQYDLAENLLTLSLS